MHDLQILTRPIGGQPSTLSEGPVADGDATGLADLVDLTGPQDLGDLIETLCADLTAVARRLDHNRPGRDWPDLAAQSHILLGLAGILGLQRLQEVAARLNSHAADQRAEGLAQSLLQAQALIAQTIVVVRRACLDPNGAP